MRLNRMNSDEKEWDNAWKEVLRMTMKRLGTDKELINIMRAYTQTPGWQAMMEKNMRELEEETVRLRKMEEYILNFVRAVAAVEEQVKKDNEEREE